MHTRTKLLITGAAGVLLAAAGAVTLHLRSLARIAATAPIDTVEVNPSAADVLLAERTMGDSTAPVTIYEFSDFQCPYCRQFAVETMPALEREYVRTGKVRLIFVNYPIPQNHPNAPAAHHFAMCAARQKRFWQYHDLLFRNQPSWAGLMDPTAILRGLADSAALDQTALTECLASNTIRWVVQGEAASAMNAGVQGTPSFLIAGALLRGTAPITALRPILDSIYRATKAAPGGKKAVPGGRGR